MQGMEIMQRGKQCTKYKSAKVAKSAEIAETENVKLLNMF